MPPLPKVVSSSPVLVYRPITLPPVTRILPSDCKAIRLSRPAAESIVLEIAKPPVPKVVSTLPSGLNRPTDPSFKNAPTAAARICPLGWMTTAVTAAPNSMPKSLLTIPPVPKLGSRVPLLLSRSRAAICEEPIGVVPPSTILPSL